MFTQKLNVINPVIADKIKIFNLIKQSISEITNNKVSASKQQ